MKVMDESRFPEQIGDGDFFLLASTEPGKVHLCRREGVNAPSVRFYEPMTLEAWRDTLNGMRAALSLGIIYTVDERNCIVVKDD